MSTSAVSASIPGFASPGNQSGKKRRLPAGDGAAAAGIAAPAVSSSAISAAGKGNPTYVASSSLSVPPLPVTFHLDERTSGMSVEEFLRDYLERAIGRANDAVDDAVDEVSLLNKQLREEIQNYRHQKRAEVAAKNKAGTFQ